MKDTHGTRDTDAPLRVMGEVLPVTAYFIHLQMIQKFIKCTSEEEEITFVGRYKAVFTLAAEVKCPLRSSAWLDASRSEVTITTIPSYAELFKSFSIFRAHGNLKLKSTIIFTGIKTDSNKGILQSTHLQFIL